jgi:NADH-quinone oxidoreductase subunit G
LTPTAGRGDDRKLLDEDEALELAAETLRGVDVSKLAVVLSAQHTTEDNLALVKLASALGAEHLYLGALGGWEGDDILRSDDNNPNRAGALRAAGDAGLKTVGELIDDVQRGDIEGLLALGWATAQGLDELSPLMGLNAVVCLSSHIGALPAVATVTIPVADVFEIDGSFVNVQGITQSFSQVLPQPPDIEPAWKTIAALASKLGQDLRFDDLASLRKELSDTAEAAQ